MRSHRETTAFRHASQGHSHYRESGNDFADRLLGEKYGPNNYPTGPGTEHNKIRKYGDRCKP